MIVAYKSGLALEQMKLSMVGICLLAIASLVLCVGATGKFICFYRVRTDLSIPSAHCASTLNQRKVLKILFLEVIVRHVKLCYEFIRSQGMRFMLYKT